MTALAPAAYAKRLHRRRIRGKVFASVSTVGQVVSAMVPVFLGWLIDIGEPRWVIWFVALLLGSLIAIVLAGRKIAMPRR